MRPEPSQRCFSSPAVEAIIQQVQSQIDDPEIARLFENCFPNTLDTTVQFAEIDGAPDTFVITGDIDAMWLRDSAAQVWPYLPLMRQDPDLQRLIEGVIRRQVRCIRLDPYANAFFRGADETGEWAHDLTAMKPGVHERKWELDSLCYFLRLSHGYWRQTDDLYPFDETWKSAVRLVLQTFREQQRNSFENGYTFQRRGISAASILPLSGRGNPTRPCGLIRSAFRPSDDATIFPYLIPANFFAKTALLQAAEILRAIETIDSLANECETLAAEITAALEKHAVSIHPEYGPVFAYEADGFGSVLFMDDANVPSLLALPYLGCVDAADPVYQNTRRMILSSANPYYFQGRMAEGNGSPHTRYGHVWPMSIILRALTSNDDAEIEDCLRLLKTTHAETGFMHESFDPNDPTDFTRPWFAWANTLFGELILQRVSR